MDVIGRWWTLHFARPTNLDADGRLWTFWRHSQGAGIETRAAHQCPDPPMSISFDAVLPDDPSTFVHPNGCSTSELRG